MSIAPLLVIACAIPSAVHAAPPPACTGPPAPPHGLWRWPLTPVPEVLRGFQPPPAPWAPGHRGVDLAARPSQPVYAAGAGQVTFAATLAGRGVVAITHDAATALRTSYLPVTPSVRPGATVSAGTRIGLLEGGPDHCAPRLCLHWGLLRGDAYLDPLSLVCHRPIRLLPVWSAPPPAADASSPPVDASAPPATASAAPASQDRQRPPHAMTLTSTTEAGGGAVAGMLLTLALALLWAQLRTRQRRRRRLPPGVIDLTRERTRRRTPSRPSTSDNSSA